MKLERADPGFVVGLIEHKVAGCAEEGVLFSNRVSKFCKDWSPFSHPHQSPRVSAGIYRSLKKIGITEV